MRKLLLLLTLLTCFFSFSQGTDPILTPESSVGRGFRNLGTYQVDGDFVLPTSLNSFTNPNLRVHGKLRYDTTDSIPKFYNGLAWKKWALKTSDLENDGENGSSPYVTKEDINNTVPFSFNEVVIPFGTDPIVSAGIWDEVFSEHGNPMYDTDLGKWIMPYSAFVEPYNGESYVGMIESESGKQGTWSKINADGQIIFTPSEDPYLVKHEGTYFLYVEKKSGTSHLDIECFTTTDIYGTWVSQGVVLSRSVGEWDGNDTSSPTVRIKDGQFVMYYEGRGFGNSGAIGIAYSNDGLTWTKSVNNPILSGTQTNGDIQWATHVVPHDFINYNGANFLHFRGADSSGGYKSGMAICYDDEELFDFYNTYFFTEDESCMFFKTENILEGILIKGGLMYQGYANTSAANKWEYTSRTTGVTIFGIKPATKNEIIETPITSNQTFLLASDLSSGAGVIKRIENISAFTLTIDPVDGVTINGSTSNLTIPAGTSVWMYTTGIDTWKTAIDNKQDRITGTGYPYFNSGVVSMITGSSTQYTRANGTVSSFAGDVQAASLGTITPNNSAITTGDSVKTAAQKAQGQIDNLNTTKAASASPTFTGDPKAPTPTAGDNDTSIATTEFVNTAIGNATGWAQYSGSNYTSGAPLVINAGNTSVLANNGVTSTITTQLPTGVTAFVNTANGKITPQNDGDFYVIDIRFKATSSSVDGVIDIGIDIGGAMGIIRQHTVALRKGIGVEQRVALSFPVFAGSTFVANGGEVKVTSITGNTSIYEVTFVVDRTHKAK